MQVKSRVSRPLFILLYCCLVTPMNEFNIGSSKEKYFLFYGQNIFKVSIYLPVSQVLCCQASHLSHCSASCLGLTSSVHAMQQSKIEKNLWLIHFFILIFKVALGVSPQFFSIWIRILNHNEYVEIKQISKEDIKQTPDLKILPRWDRAPPPRLEIPRSPTVVEPSHN